MTIDWRIRQLEAEVMLLRNLLAEAMGKLGQALEERDRARETATRLEQELHGPPYIDHINTTAYTVKMWP